MLSRLCLLKKLVWHLLREAHNKIKEWQANLQAPQN